MDRRTFLALAASLPALCAARADACSVALKNPDAAGLQNQQVRRLFQAWWDRDVEKFREYFTQRLTADGTRLGPNLAAELAAQDPLPPDTFDVFDKHFIDKDKFNRITLIVNTDAAILVACSESDMPLKILPDCAGLPKLHLFAIRMIELNPRSITHVGTTETVAVDRFSVWTEGSS